MPIRILFALNTALLFVLAPFSARACAVCSGYASEEVRQAFVSATAFMTFTPLLLVGAIAWWIFRQYRTAEQGDASSEGDHDL